MKNIDPDQNAKSLAAESLSVGDPTGWFEKLYGAAAEGAAIVPWDRGAPHFLLVNWAQGDGLRGEDQPALVIGSGYGSDAEFVAGLGFHTVAFDVSEEAVRAARARFPDSQVNYLAADLLEPPTDWKQAFDLVVESLTVQSLPRSLRERAIANVADMVAPGGRLLVISGVSDEPLDDGPPWTLTREEVEGFANHGLRAVKIELIPDEGEPSIRRWRAEFERLEMSSPRPGA